jgi:hypothetical protein
MANKLYRVLPEFYADWGVYNDDEAIVDMEQIIWLSGEWETPVEELMEQVEEVKANNEESKEQVLMELADEMNEMIALGWEEEEAHEDEDAFLGRLGDYAEDLTLEEIWQTWKNVWEIRKGE